MDLRSFNEQEPVNESFFISVKLSMNHQIKCPKFNCEDSINFNDSNIKKAETHRKCPGKFCLSIKDQRDIIHSKLT